MSEAEKRINTIEIGIPAHPMTGVSRALCEIARQLARIADLYEFELGLDSDGPTRVMEELRGKRDAPNGQPDEVLWAPTVEADAEVPWTEDK